jgi:drug/metabolite transporter (DMT)-like permease
MQPNSPSRPVSKWTAVSLLVFVNILWGLSFPLTKTINLEVDEHFGISAHESSSALRLSAAAFLILFRFTSAFILFWLIFPKIMRRATSAEWWAGTQIGTFFYIGLMLQIVALATIPASRSGFLTSLVAVFTPLLTAVLLRVRPRFPVVLGVGIALLGVSVLTGLVVWTRSGIVLASDAWQAWTPGDSLTTLGAIFFAGQIMLVDHYGKRLDAAALTPGMFASTAVYALLTFCVASPLVPEISSAGWMALGIQPRFWILILTLSFLSSVVAFNLMNSYQHYVSASQAGIIYTLEPVCASAAAMVLPGMLSSAFGVPYANERMVMPMVVGGGLIVVANLVSLWPTSSTSRPPQDPDAEPPGASDVCPGASDARASASSIRPDAADERFDGASERVSVG